MVSLWFLLMSYNKYIHFLTSYNYIILAQPHSPFVHAPWACQRRKSSQCNPVRRQPAVSGWGCIAHREHLHLAAKHAHVSWKAWQWEKEKKNNCYPKQTSWEGAWIQQLPHCTLEKQVNSIITHRIGFLIRTWTRISTALWADKIHHYIYCAMIWMPILWLEAKLTHK